MTTDTVLTSRAFRLHASPDLLDYYAPASGFYFEHGGDGIVGVGAALRVAVLAGPDHVARAAASARDALASIARGEGPAPVVVGALPYEGTTAFELVVPALTVIRSGNDAWLVEVGRAGVALPETMPHEPPPEPWDTLRVRSEEDPASYVRAVERARSLIHEGELQKVVLARTVLAESDHEFDVPALLEKLRRLEPNAYMFGVRGFMGASPELLVARTGSEVRARPLAGTIARRDGAAEQLLSSPKDRAEHAFVADAVQRTLEPLTSSLRSEGPRILEMSSVLHLRTDFRGTVTPPAPDALQLAAALHPTPAVCGFPRDRAARLISELEQSPRGLYAGAVGWVDADGDGEWAVALRCAEVDGARARLFAGAGIVEASDPDAELAETDTKMRALLDALRYG